MRMLLIAVAVAVLPGCTVTDRATVGLENTPYTRAEIDAIAARIECRAAARTLIQIYRCEGR